MELTCARANRRVLTLALVVLNEFSWILAYPKPNWSNPMTKRKLKALRLIEKMGRIKCVDPVTNRYESRWWRLSRDNVTALIGLFVTFHRRQGDPSYMGGPIIGFYFEFLKLVLVFEPNPAYIGITSPGGWGQEKKLDRDE